MTRADIARPACAQALAGLRQGEWKPMAAWLREHLLGHVLPFWERHAFDGSGGILTCLSDAGEVRSTEKWLWSQWRAVWVYSRLHRRVERDPRWLQHARDIAEFCLRSGWDASADGWALLVSREGRILRSGESIYVDAFAIYGLVELYHATGDEALLAWARRTADAALKKLSGPRDRVPHFPYAIPAGAKPHGLPMMWSLVLAELGAALRDERYLDAARAFSDEIFRDFHCRKRDLILEWRRLDGGEFAAPAGTAVVPGHAIESMWFQLHVGDLLGPDEERASIAFRLMLRHLEAGWDPLHGGLRLAVDAGQGEAVGWNFADTKLWWPHTEALYATLLGWHRTGRTEFLEWYERIWSFCLSHFVDWQHGEWRQRLNRVLAPIEDVVALPVKDPFHLPRSLMLQLELLEGVEGATKANPI